MTSNWSVRSEQGSEPGNADQIIPDTPAAPAPSPPGPAHRAPDRPPFEPLYCDICEMYLNGIEQYRNHKEGKKHRTSLKRWRREHPDEALPEGEEEQPPDPPPQVRRPPQPCLTGSVYEAFINDFRLRYEELRSQGQVPETRIEILTEVAPGVVVPTMLPGIHRRTLIQPSSQSDRYTGPYSRPAMKDRENQTVMTHKWMWKKPRLARATEMEWFDCMKYYDDDEGPSREFKTKISQGGPLKLKGGRPMIEKYNEYDTDEDDAVSTKVQPSVSSRCR